MKAPNLILVAVGLVLAACKPPENAAPEKKEPEKPSPVSHNDKGETVLKFDAEALKRLNLQLAPLVAASHSPEARAFGRVLDPGLYPIQDVAIGDPILHTLYNVRQLLQVSSMQFWRANGGRVSERGADSAEVHYRAIRDENGRVMVMMTHNTDVADTWEREGESHEYFDTFSPTGDRKSTRLNSSHSQQSRMPSSA